MKFLFSRNEIPEQVEHPVTEVQAGIDIVKDCPLIPRPKQSDINPE